jgi:hypothetical protein
MKWITRKGIKVDRVACPWLIRRFIDREAQFLFVDEADLLRSAAAENATPFDAPRLSEVKLNHRGHRCSFEAILEDYGLADPILQRCGLIVRAADVKGQESAAAEGAALARLRMRRPVPPVLDKTIEFVADHIPAATGVVEAVVIEAQMRSKRLTAGLFPLDSVIKAAELLGRRPPFAITQVNGERLLHAKRITPLLSIIRIARRVVARHGIATVSEVVAKLRNEASHVCQANLIAGVLARERSFRWLDPSRVWFWSTTGINPVLHRIRKVVSVVNPIRASDLRAGIFRSVRMKGFSPPIEVFLEFCRQAPGLRVDNDTIVAEPSINPDEVLSQIEKEIVDTLYRNGGLLTASELKSACLHMGLNQTTCYLYLVHSPFISKFAHNRYGLIRSDENLLNGLGIGARH